MLCIEQLDSRVLESTLPFSLLVSSHTYCSCTSLIPLFHNLPALPTTSNIQIQFPQSFCLVVSHTSFPSIWDTVDRDGLQQARRNDMLRRYWAEEEEPTTTTSIIALPLLHQNCFHDENSTHKTNSLQLNNQYSNREVFSSVTFM